MRLYESMFLVENARAKENLDNVMDALKEMIARAGGEVVNMGKWDERRLTFQIRRQRRGTYILCHWNGVSEAPAKLERSCRLSDSVLRLLTVVDEDGPEITKPREESRGRETHVRKEGSDRPSSPKSVRARKSPVKTGSKEKAKDRTRDKGD